MLAYMPVSTHVGKVSKALKPQNTKPTKLENKAEYQKVNDT